MSDPHSGVVNVKIYDREYALRTTGDAERLRSLCAYLDRRMRELAGSSGSVDTLKVAVLSALSMADELYRAREALRKMDDAIGRRSLACVSMLNRVQNPDVRPQAMDLPSPHDNAKEVASAGAPDLPPGEQGE